MIKHISSRLRPTGDISLFHDSRGDIRRLSMLINQILDKQMEIIAHINRLEREISKKAGAAVE